MGGIRARGLEHQLGLQQPALFPRTTLRRRLRISLLAKIEGDNPV